LLADFLFVLFHARPKTDVLDVQWIQRLHAYGLLQPSFYFINLPPQ
jgi:hypothetical protein